MRPQGTRLQAHPLRGIGHRLARHLAAYVTAFEELDRVGWNERLGLPARRVRVLRLGKVRGAGSGVCTS